MVRAQIDNEEVITAPIVLVFSFLYARGKVLIFTKVRSSLTSSHINLLLPPWSLLSHCSPSWNIFLQSSSCVFTGLKVRSIWFSNRARQHYLRSFFFFAFFNRCSISLRVYGGTIFFFPFSAFTANNLRTTWGDEFEKLSFNLLPIENDTNLKKKLYAWLEGKRGDAAEA